jgi:outer membrane protein assembly factor BamB
LPRSLTLDKAAGILYIGSANGTVYALRADSGKQVWRPFATRSQIETAPAVFGDHVYVCNDSGELYALNAETGALRWRFRTGEQGYCAPAVNPSSGIVYVAGSGTSNGRVYAIKPNRREAWPKPFTTRRAIRSAPTVNFDGTLLYVASADGTIYALGTSHGDQQWVHATGHPIYQSSPTQYGIMVYVGTYDGYVYTLQALNGGKLNSSCHVGGKINSTPNLFNNTIYIGDGNGKVYALNQSKEC